MGWAALSTARAGRRRGRTRAEKRAAEEVEVPTWWTPHGKAWTATGTATAMKQGLVLSTPAPNVPTPCRPLWAASNLGTLPAA